MFEINEKNASYPGRSDVPFHRRWKGSMENVDDLLNAVTMLNVAFDSLSKLGLTVEVVGSELVIIKGPIGADEDEQYDNELAKINIPGKA